MRKRPLALLLLVVLVPMLAAVVFRFWWDRRTRKLLPGLTAALQAETSAFEKLDWPRPPAFGEAVPGTAWDHYRRAEKLEGEIDETLFDVDGFFDAVSEYHLWERPPEPVPMAWRPFLERYEPVLTALMEGARTETAGRANFLRGGMVPGYDEFPDWKGAASVAISLRDPAIAAASAALEAGEVDRALDLMISLDRLGEDLFRGGTLLDPLMGAGLRFEVARVLSIWVAGGLIPAEGIARIRSWLERSPAAPPFSRERYTPNWLSEQWTWRRVIEGKDADYRDLLLWRSPQEQYDRRRVPLLTIVGWKWLREMEARLAATLPLDTPADAFRYAREFSRLAATESYPRNFFAKFHGGSYEAIPRVWNYLALARSTLLVNLALHEYRVEHGRDPDPISEILPPGVAALPTRGPWTWWDHPDVEFTWLQSGDRPPEREYTEAEIRIIQGAIEKLTAPGETPTK